MRSSEAEERQVHGERTSTAAPAPEHPLVLVFDDRCRLCTAISASIRRRDKQRRIQLLPASTLAGPDGFGGLTPSAARGEVHLVGIDGTLWRGSAVLSPIAAALPGWRWLAPLLRRRPVARLVAAVWLLLKQLRHQL